MKTILKLSGLSCILLVLALSSTSNAQGDRAGTTSDRRDKQADQANRDIQADRADRGDQGVRANQDAGDRVQDLLATDALASDAFSTRQAGGGIRSSDRGDAFDLPAGDVADGGSGMVSSRGMSSEERKYVRAVRSCVSQLKNAKSDSETVALTDKIRDSLEGLFSARTTRRQKEIDALQTRIEDLRRLNQQREDNRRQLIDLKLNTIVNEAKGIGF